MASTSVSRGAAGSTDASTQELVERLKVQLRRLARDEVRLARIEMQRRGRRAGAGAGLLGGAGVLAFYGGAALVTAAVLGLAVVWAAWLASLVVGLALLLVAALAALVGRGQVRRSMPLVPEQAWDRLRQDIAVVRERARS
ncbi:hypothetical protein GCM10012275_64260 [Longimycelium tulufanense]|uniref:Phage holin family protein n=1 Tax=Longimycelium tulufanense TaxID=907463 RepID=A0A8J3CLE4_9PSEU|nr:phage holin family protein [Longimycelium tulufanense]GGM84688.1 hypothetical protein GCM10012275_64260 [Longimycelium tulufanense]